MKKLPIGRTIASVIAGVFVVVGVYFIVWSVQYRREFYQALEARPIDMAVDLSQPGEFSGQLHQTRRTPYLFQPLYLEVPPDVLHDVSVPDMVSKLRFNYAIADAQGKMVVESKFEGDLAASARFSQGTLQIGGFAYFETGKYTLTFRVTEGVPELAGIPQRLASSYLLCGMEMMSVLLGTVIGIASIIVAGIILLRVRAITKRKKRRS